jgi:hypothetical protein
MRKIESRLDIEKKGSRNKVIIGVILGIIMFISVVGYSFSYFNKAGVAEGGSANKMKYNGMDFSLNEMGLWQASIGDYVYTFKFSPRDTENISLSSLKLPSPNDYLSKPLFFSSEDGLAENEIARNMQYFVQRMQEACINESGDCVGKDVPVKNCSSDNVIIIKITNETNIEKQDNCIFISADKDNIVRVSDAFLYGLFGIRNV